VAGILYVTLRGLTTSAIPCASGGFDCELDCIDHQLRIRASDGSGRTVALAPEPVALFYAETMGALDELGIHTHLQASPNEVDPAIPFAHDNQHTGVGPLAWTPELLRSEVQAAVVRTCRASKVAGAIWPRAECLRRGL
jgi:hypothetical protein